MVDTCLHCGEGKDPANPDRLDWDTLNVQRHWQCNDCDQWNDDLGKAALQSPTFMKWILNQ